MTPGEDSVGRQPARVAQAAGGLGDCREAGGGGRAHVAGAQVRMHQQRLVADLAATPAAVSRAA
jgi:hypothetical protein